MDRAHRFYDLRHTGHSLSTRSGSTLKETMVRAGQSSEKAAMCSSWHPLLTAVYRPVGHGSGTMLSTALGARWGELVPDLRHADFTKRGLRALPAAAVPRGSPLDPARLWNGELLIRS